MGVGADRVSTRLGLNLLALAISLAGAAIFFPSFASGFALLAVVFASRDYP